jgi:hypothetical protein
MTKNCLANRSISKRRKIAAMHISGISQVVIPPAISPGICSVPTDSLSRRYLYFWDCPQKIQIDFLSQAGPEFDPTTQGGLGQSGRRKFASQ